MERGKEIAAEAQELVEDIVAEAKSEMAEAGQAEISSSPEAAPASAEPTS